MLFKTEMAFKTPGSFSFEGNDYERQITENMWRSAESWGMGCSVPTNLYYIQGQLLTLPRMGQLKGGG